MTLTESDLATLRSCASAHVSDAMEMLALRRTVITGYSLIGDPGITVVGTAFTVRQVPKHAIHAKDMGLVRHKEVSYEQARAGEVVVVDVGGWTDVCSWGEFHSYHCKSRGVAGTVLNGATRDAHGIRMLGYPVFCRGFSPVKSRWDLETVGLRETVTLGRVQVRHGDIVVADETGILIVPPEHKDAIVGKAAEVRDAEVEEMARLRQGMSLR